MVELVVPQGDDAYEVQLSQDGTKDGEAAEDGRWDKRIAANSYVQGTFARLAWFLSKTIHSCIVDDLPSRASSKQCPGSQCDVKMVTLWPRFWRPTAASMTNLSAPPIPRSGWKKTILFFCAIADRTRQVIRPATLKPEACRHLNPAVSCLVLPWQSPGVRGNYVPRPVNDASLLLHSICCNFYS
jgi:hypothetical protein